MGSELCSILLFIKDSKIIKSNQPVLTNIAIASAVTAYVRMIMHQYKLYPGANLYYTDTDLIIINKALPDKLVESAIGQIKLENKI